VVSTSGNTLNLMPPISAAGPEVEAMSDEDLKAELEQPRKENAAAN
jgi:hypothetical protein